MNDIRYNVKDTERALRILGFNVRNPDGGTSLFCIHTLIRAEVWIPKVENGVLEDVLEYIFKPINLPIVFFKSVYMSLRDVNKFPSDQY